MITNHKDAPSEWRSVRLGDILAPVNIRARNVTDEDLPVLSMTRHDGLILQSEKFDKRVASRDTDNYLVVRRNDIVCGFPMDEGVVYALTRFPIGIVSPAYQVWEVTREDVDVRFLDLLLKSPPLIRIYRGLAANVVERRRSIGKRDFSAIEVQLPSLDEQKKIAAVLLTVQQAKERTEAAIQAARALKKSLLKYLFTYGPVPVDQAEEVELKETEIGDVPEAWELVQLEAIAEINAEGSKPSEKFEGEYFPYLDISSVAENAGGILNLEMIPCEDAPSRARRVIRTNDVIMSTVRPYLKAYALVGSEHDGSICSTGFAVLSTKNGTVPAFLLYALLSPAIQSQFRRYMRGANYPALNLGHVKQTIIPWPPISEQKAIGTVLPVVDEKIAVEEDHKRALDEFFSSLLNDLMTAKMRVDDLDIGGCCES